jgi:hypothetical protein
MFIICNCNNNIIPPPLPTYEDALKMVSPIKPLDINGIEEGKIKEGEGELPPPPKYSLTTTTLSTSTTNLDNITTIMDEQQQNNSTST